MDPNAPVPAAVEVEQTIEAAMITSNPRIALPPPPPAESGSAEGPQPGVSRRAGGLVFGVAAVTVAGALAVGAVLVVLVVVGAWMML
jgi:hypothetical protein